MGQRSCQPQPTCAPQPQPECHQSACGSDGGNFNGNFSHDSVNVLSGNNVLSNDFNHSLNGNILGLI